MLRDHFHAFDEDVIVNTNYYTSDELVKRLAKCDQLAFFAVVDKPSIAGRLEVQIEHSGDGIHFVSKLAAPEIDDVINTTTYVRWGSDDGTIPTLPYVRLRIKLLTIPSSHVRIYAALRDIG